MVGRNPRFAAIVAAVAVLGGLTACSDSTPAPTKTVTVVETPTPSPSAANSAGSTSASSSQASSTPTHLTKLPGDCYSLLPISVIAPALGHAMRGKTAFVVGKPDKDIGRLGYINCRYGVPAGKGTPDLEIGVSLYNSAEQASQRIPATATDYMNHGATQSTVTVADEKATILTGGRGKGYAAPTLVAAAGQRTIAITLNDPKVPAAKSKSTLTKLAAVTLKQTATTS